MNRLETRKLMWGCYPMEFTAGIAGVWGCDPCDLCDRRPKAGDRVWLSRYPDLLCDDCAERIDCGDLAAAGSGGQ